VGPGIEALREGLRNTGWTEGGNLYIEYRGAGGQVEQLPSLAQELVDLKPDVIVAFSPQSSAPQRTPRRPFPSFSSPSQSRFASA